MSTVSTLLHAAATPSHAASARAAKKRTSASDKVGYRTLKSVLSTCSKTREGVREAGSRTVSRREMMLGPPASARSLRAPKRTFAGQGKCNFSKHL